MIAAALQHFIGSARWFGGKGRNFRIGDIHRLGWLPDPSSATEPTGIHARIELVTVEYDDGDTELYQLPLAYFQTDQDRLEHAFVGEWEDDELGHVFVYDALQDRESAALWLAAFDAGLERDDLVFHRLPGHELDTDAPSSLFSGEQSNSSVRFGEDSLMKVFRKVTPGRNPDIEIHEALTKAGSDHVAALYGWLEVPVRHAEESDASTASEPLQLAMLQQLLRTASDGWDLALASVRDLFAEGDLHADEVGGDFAAESYRLGEATAQVHDALAEHFPTQTWGVQELAELADAMNRRLEEAVKVVDELAPHADALRETFSAVTRLSEPVVVQRIHADFHLGQTLRTVRGWKIVDFEGEPAKPLAERMLPDSAWRDVAGMLRSFDYAAHAVAADFEEEGPQIAYRAMEWVDRNRTAFLDGYVEASDRTKGGELSAEQEVLLRAYEVDKAVYETVYEARNRPTWIHIPLAAIARLTRSDSHHREASS